MWACNVDAGAIAQPRGLIGSPRLRRHGPPSSHAPAAVIDARRRPGTGRYQETGGGRNVTSDDDGAGVAFATAAADILAFHPRGPAALDQLAPALTNLSAAANGTGYGGPVSAAWRDADADDPDGGRVVLAAEAGLPADAVIAVLLPAAASLRAPALIPADYPAAVSSAALAGQAAPAGLTYVATAGAFSHSSVRFVGGGPWAPAGTEGFAVGVAVTWALSGRLREGESVLLRLPGFSRVNRSDAAVAGSEAGTGGGAGAAWAGWWSEAAATLALTAPRTVPAGAVTQITVPAAAGIRLTRGAPPCPQARSLRRSPRCSHRSVPEPEANPHAWASANTHAESYCAYMRGQRTRIQPAPARTCILGLVCAHVRTYETACPPLPMHRPESRGAPPSPPQPPPPPPGAYAAPAPHLAALSPVAAGGSVAAGGLSGSGAYRPCGGHPQGP